MSEQAGVLSQRTQAAHTAFPASSAEVLSQEVQVAHALFPTSKMEVLSQRVQVALFEDEPVRKRCIVWSVNF